MRSPTDRVIEELKRPLTDYRSIVELAESGVRLYMIVGQAKHGKSQFLYALSRALDSVYGTGSLEEPPPTTEPDFYFGWRLRARKLSLFFFDISGDDFQNIIDLPKPSLLMLLAHVLKHVRGIAVNIALHKHWSPGSPFKPDQALAVCQRFLSYVVAAQSGPSKDSDSLMKTYQGSDLPNKVVHWPPLNIPLLINFSMADMYKDGSVKIPPVRRPEWARHLPLKLPQHTVDPLRDDPAALAALYMPQLYSFLRERARWFKFAFTQARTEEDVNNYEGCIEAFEFLVQASWSGWLDSRFFHWSHFVPNGRLKRFQGQSQ